MPFLKDIIAQNGGTPIDFVFVSRSPKYTKKKKDGTFMDVYDYTFHTRADGKNHTEMIMDFVHDASLAAAQVNQICRASLNAKGFVAWEVLPMGPESASIPQPASGSAMVKAERQFSAQSSANDQAATAHDWKLGLAGIVQAMIIAGKDPGEITGDILYKGQAMSAFEWARWIRNKANELAKPIEDDPESPF